MDHTPDDTDLPDHHYESIYGREAMHARLLAKLDAMLTRMDERTEALREVTARMDATRRPARPQDG
jgi:alpha-D-ribose 1-methylphosphonate 5-triphosphate synthase subunit PhnG